MSKSYEVRTDEHPEHFKLTRRLGQVSGGSRELEFHFHDPMVMNFSMLAANGHSAASIVVRTSFGSDAILGPHELASSESTSSVLQPIPIPAGAVLVIKGEGLDDAGDFVGCEFWLSRVTEKVSIA